jgi:NADPH2:quinone reductase
VRAIVVHEYGPIGTHRVEDFAVPRAGPDEVVVAVKAIGLNFPDALMLQGKYQNKPDQLPFVPGRDASGIVTEVGAGVSRIRVGDRVLVQVFSGAFAEFVAAPEQRCFAMADELDFIPGAALITPYHTAFVAAIIRGDVKAGETALVTGAAGGVGLATVQLLKARGAHVIAAVSSQEKADLVTHCGGADDVIYTHFDDLKDTFRSQIGSITDNADGRGVDLAIDTVGGDVFDACLRVLKFAGRLVIVGFSDGRIPAAKANYLLFNNLTVMGAPLDAHFKHAYEQIEQGAAEIGKLYAEGRIDPQVMQILPLEQFVEGFDLILTRQVKGKVILTS